jgi:hypothetical protein
MKAIIKILILICFIFTDFSLYSQEIKIIRTDVDSSRSNFVTATYSFGMDIIVQNLKRCNLVTFELVYTHSENIKFSEFSILNFGDSANAQVIPRIDNITKNGSVAAAVYSGDTIGSRGYDNPKVIHFEFITTATSIHGTMVNFIFSNAYAVITDTNNTGKIVPLKSETTTYRINSFINAWPGDADNNGKVDNLDFAQIGLFLQSDSAKKSWRSFKRFNPSTLWYAQQVLAWDTIAAAYSDCDGNGEVTIDDMGVVYINFDSVHTVSKIHKSDEPEINPVEYKPPKTANTILIPVYISPTEPFIAATGRIKLSNKTFNIIGIDKGNLFETDKIHIFCNILKDEQIIEFSIGSLDRTEAKSDGVLIYLLAEPLNDMTKDISPDIYEINGFSKSGYKFSLLVISDIKEDNQGNIINENFQIIQNSDGIIINNYNNEIIKEIRIFDIAGNQIISKNIQDNNQDSYIFIPLANITQGIYLVNIITNIRYYIKSITISH